MTDLRKASCYLVACPSKSSGLSFRITVGPPRLAADEIAMQLNVVLPDAIFRRAILKATVEIPRELVTRPAIDAVVVDNIKSVVSQQMGVDLTIAVVEPAQANA